MSSFDLLTEPWIPVLDAGADLRASPDAPVVLREVGLREALLRAHELREVYTDSPLETVALYRLLLALALDVYQRAPDVEGWTALWRSGHFPAAPLDAYLADPTLGLDRFDLLHPARPFYQRATPDASQTDKEPAPLAKLFHAQASGNNATLFGHDLDSRPNRLPLAHAARGLVTTQAAALGGGVSQPFNFSHAPLVGRAQFWIRGRSLFDALLLNGPPDREARMGAPPKDAPAWRREPTTYARRRHQGLLDMLTWPARRLTLATETTDGEARATGVYLTQGDKLDPQPIDDPLAAHVAGKDEGIFPLGFRAGRALWRDASVLFNTADPSRNGAPATFRWLSGFAAIEAPAEVGELRRVFREQGVDAFGLVNDQAKAELWRHERLPLHLSILRDPGRQLYVRDALADAETQLTGKQGLRRAIRVTAEYALAPPAPGDDAYPSADPKAVSALAQSLGAEPRYWAGLESSFFDFLGRLADADDAVGQTAVLAAWRREVSVAALRAFDDATSSFDCDARHLRATAEGRARLVPIAAISKGESPPVEPQPDLSPSPI
jgi:CRISPR system Cascade subunit CasA